MGPPQIDITILTCACFHISIHRYRLQTYSGLCLGLFVASLQCCIAPARVESGCLIGHRIILMNDGGEEANGSLAPIQTMDQKPAWGGGW